MDQSTGAVETWRANQYAANVSHLSQQKGSRLANLVRNESFRGKAEFFDRLGSATAQLKSSTRGTATPDLNIVHSRRMLTAEIYEWATLCDRMDKLENIHSPENEYAKSAMMALGRSMDDVIIAAALGTAATGETGGTAVGNTKEDTVASVASTAIAYLNVAALKNAKYIMDKNEVEGQRHIVCRAIDIQNLLGETSVTSADYNTVRALVQGEIDTFLGFKFHRSERLPVAAAGYNSDAFKFNTTTGLYDASGTAIADSYSSYKLGFAFVGDGLIFGKQEGMKSHIEPRADKSYDMQVYVSMNFGAVRMEEAKVVPLVLKA